MNSGRWHEIDELLVLALGVPEGHRAQFLAGHCAEDADLREEVTALLEALAAAEGFLDEPARGWPQGPRLPHAESYQTGAEIGPFKLEEELGRGGMSTVYLAVRNDREYRQRVAVKLIRPGRDTETVLRRFRAERQILANLDHPNVARLLGGGTTLDGRPYFVMEHIEGTHIDRYCADHALSPDDRIRLFLKVCDAVQYAHQHLVVHRDLKPANVLVSADGVPKLLDFGIAKLLDPGEFPQTVEETVPGSQPMTPQWASPEQLTGRPVTTSTDVYALGLLLHKLLTGRLPDEREDAVAEETGRQALSDDRRNILNMALNPEANLRYPSAEQLAEDLRRELAGLPVQAARDSRLYRLKKALRRHRSAVAIATAFLALVVLFTVNLSRQVERTSKALVEAERERHRAEEISALLFGLFEGSDPGAARGRELSARDLLDRGVAQLETLGNEPLVQAAAFDTIGRIYGELALYEPAVEMLERGLELRRQELGDAHPEIAVSLSHLGRLLTETGDYRRAEALLRDALALRRSLLGEDHLDVAESQFDQASVLWHRGRFSEAEELYRQALDLRRKWLAPDDPLVLATLNELGNLLASRGEWRSAEKQYRLAYEGGGRSLPEDHPERSTFALNLASALSRQGRHDQVDPLLREALEIRRRVLGPSHPDVAMVLHNLGSSLLGRGELDAAEDALTEALEIRRHHFGELHVTVAANLSVLASLHRRRGDLRRASELYRRCIEIARRQAPDHPELAWPLLALAEVLMAQDQPKLAAPLLREAYDLRRQALPKGSPLVADAAAALSACLRRIGRKAEADELLGRIEEPARP